MEDGELLAAWRMGDAEAGDKLMRRHYGAVRRFFELKFPGRADDLTQQTFLACAEARDRYRADGTFKGFLFGIARHKLMEQMRAQERERRPTRFGEEEANATRLSTLLARRQEHQLVLQGLAALTVDSLVPLQLYYWDGLRTAEIGQALGIATSTVTSRLARARAALRKEIERLAMSPSLRDRALADLERWTRELPADPG